MKSSLLHSKTPQPHTFFSFHPTKTISFPLPSTNPRLTIQSKKPLSTLKMASCFNPEQSRSPLAITQPTPPLSQFKIGLCQLSVTIDKERYFAHARRLSMMLSIRMPNLFYCSRVSVLTKPNLRLFDTGGKADDD